MDSVVACNVARTTLAAASYPWASPRLVNRHISLAKVENWGNIIVYCDQSYPIGVHNPLHSRYLLVTIIHPIISDQHTIVVMRSRPAKKNGVHATVKEESSNLSTISSTIHSVRLINISFTRGRSTLNNRSQLNNGKHVSSQHQNGSSIGASSVYSTIVNTVMAYQSGQCFLIGVYIQHAPISIYSPNIVSNPKKVTSKYTTNTAGTNAPVID